KMPEDALARVQITPFKMRLGGIATTPVIYRLLGREIRAVGSIEHDETCEVRASARIRGRIEKLWVNYAGQQVTRGDPLFSIYSPQLLIASVVFSTALGILGGLYPALRASRMLPMDAIRRG
ncbi:MAG: efflux RND transporter periplasmic adaptor subunit, partial [Planctomycetia bacterium]|nr:efflux RND transporter periplasmic adaptor subunit [Planctomycetia bacterium]